MQSAIRGGTPLRHDPSGSRLLARRLAARRSCFRPRDARHDRFANRTCAHATRRAAIDALAPLHTHRRDPARARHLPPRSPLRALVHLNAREIEQLRKLQREPPQDFRTDVLALEDLQDPRASIDCAELVRKGVAAIPQANFDLSRRSPLAVRAAGHDHEQMRVRVHVVGRNDDRRSRLLLLGTLRRVWIKPNDVATSNGLELLRRGSRISRCPGPL